jgi:anaerobic selenocysteine-containing dehydrogenase
MLNVQMSKGVFEPASDHLRSETWIVCQLAKAVLGDSDGINWDLMASSYDHIRDAIERVVPGFENYNERIRKKGGFYLPNPPNKGEFKTQTGKAQFKASKLNKITLLPGQLLLTTIRSHDQFNTTIYDLDDRYRGISGGRHVVFMNESDIEERKLMAGQKVDITSHFADGERHAKGFTIVSYPIPKGCAAAYFPEANPLIPIGSRAHRSYTPTSKLIVISVKPSS